MESATTKAAQNAREIVSRRLIGARPDQIFGAIRDSERLARWWGPKGFRNSFEVFEFRPGGAWRFVMHGPDGTDYPNESVFRAIEEPSRVEFEHLPDPHFLMTISLQPRADGTEFGFRMLFDSADVRDRVATYAIPCNEENFDRLEAELGQVAGRASVPAGTE